MPSSKSSKVGKPHLRRDDQKWVFDYIIKETGKTFHFQPDGRGRLPRTVRSHDMIARHVGLAVRATTESERKLQFRGRHDRSCDAIHHGMHDDADN